IDAEGQILGRICSQVAALLRGKHKPDFTPFADCGDYVIVINAAKIRLTGQKMTDKKYIRHTGYPGGQRSLSPTEMMARDPRRMVEMAVQGMLPKNKLGAQMYRNLHVYGGTEHKHEGQTPEIFELKYDSKA
ncbi:MAG TPA: 50S ribosomal protein L13, partial [Bacteroidetes bacterium]|nr:50S ribosomal protein L13 [Bacteroidota bacterium]